MYNEYLITDLQNKLNDDIKLNVLLLNYLKKQLKTT